MTPEEYRAAELTMRKTAKHALDNGEYSVARICIGVIERLRDATWPPSIVGADGVSWQQLATQWRGIAEKAEECVNCAGCGEV